ncbi:MAG TPA: hypothetical protein VFU71_07360, partial [Burkholderiaceae bacterium]|nr:hypothetical protein [Burkholderiaceae bacterium]
EIASLRWRLLEVREQTYDLQGMRSEQSDDVETLRMLAEAMGDDCRRAYAAYRRSNLAYRIVDTTACERAAQTAIALASFAGDHVLRLRAQRLLAFARRDSGDFESAKAVAQQGLAEARQLGLKSVESGFLDTLAGIVGWQEDLLGTVELSCESLRIEREIKDRRGEVLTLGNLGAAWLGLGDFEQAAHVLEEGLQLARSIGDRANEGNCLVNLAQVSQWQGDGERALALSRAAHDLAAAMKAPDYEIFALLVRGDAELHLGHSEEAFGTYDRALSLALRIDSPLRHNATAGLIRVALAQGDTAAALRHVEALLPHLSTGRALDGADSPRLIELTCYRALSRVSDPRAAQLLHAAYAALRAKADSLVDAARRDEFLGRIPHHREIVAAWRMLSPVTHGGPNADA